MVHSSLGRRSSHPDKETKHIKTESHKQNGDTTFETHNVLDSAPAPDFKFKQTCIAKESHGKTIFGIAVNTTRCLTEYEPLLLATVAGPHCTIYQCITEETEETNQNLILLQNFTDPQGDKEEFYCCAWTRDIACTDFPAESPVIADLDQPEKNNRLGSFPAALTDDVPKNEQLLAIAGKRGVIRILAPSLANCPVSLASHGQSINELRFHPKHPLLLFSFSKDHTIRLWNIATKVLVCIFGGAEGHRSEVLHGDVSLSGNLLLSAGMDHTIKIWRLDSNSMQHAIKQSFTYRAKDNTQPYPTVLQHFPEFSTREVHGNYIDCARWYGSFIISKSCEKKVTMWSPGALEQNHLDMTLAEQQDKSRLFSNGFSFVDNIWLPTPMPRIDHRFGDISGVPTEHKVTIVHQMKATSCDLWYIRFDVDLRNHRLALGTGTGPSRIYIWDLTQIPHAFSLNPQVLNINFNSFRTTHTDTGVPFNLSSVRQTRFANGGKILFAVGDNGLIVRFDLKS